MQQDSLLFRQEALDAQKTPSLGTIRLATPVSHHIWALAAVGITVAILFWLFAGYYTRRERIACCLVPQAGLLTLTARSAGTVTSIVVTEGAVVHAGEALLTIFEDRSSATTGDTSEMISAQLRQQQTRLQVGLANTQRLADEQADDLRRQHRMLTEQISQVDVHPARAAKPRVWPAVAPGATETLRPARLVQRPIALRLGAIPLDELHHRQPRLELHLVHGHDRSPPRNLTPRLRRGRLTSSDGWLSEVANQENRCATLISYEGEKK